jgi:flagellar basal-body rod protein FlgF
MDNALLIGLSRQVVLSRELEVVANNLANINTTGYKADNSLFEQFFMPEASAGEFPPGSRGLAYVEDRAAWHNLSAGPLLNTGNPLDVAIDGNAFLVVQSAGGQRYTRNGALQIRADGTLVTSAGDPVLGTGGPIQFQTTDHDIHIGEDGTITVREGAGATTDALRGQLQLAQFANASALQKEGANLFSAPGGAVQQGTAQNVRIVQGAVEQSNVTAVTEMARMIQVSRAYEDIANILQLENTQRTSALDKLAAVPA